MLIVNPEPGVLSRQYQTVLEIAMKDADYGYRYHNLAASGFAENLIDPGLFQEAYQTTHGFKANDHLYSTGQARASFSG